MRQVFYIEADEEMISVIGRVRKSPATENVIVAPYRSLILQSIVNLRLLSHDAQKNGKEIIVVTQDQQSRSLCEKAGIRTQAMLDNDDLPQNRMQQQQRQNMPSTQQYPQQQTPAPAYEPQPQMGQSQQMQAPQQEMSSRERNAMLQLPFSDALGSTGFYGNDPYAQNSQMPMNNYEVQRQTQSQLQPQQQQQPQQMESFAGPQVSPYSNTRQVPIRDNTPKTMTTLNSQRFEEERMLNQQKSFTPPSLRGAQPARPSFASPAMPTYGNAPTPMPQRQPMMSSPQQQQQQQQQPIPRQPQQPSQGGGVAAFLGQRNNNAAQKPPLAMPIAQSVPEKTTVVSDGGKMRAFFIFFGFISILSVAGVAAYLFLPKADVHVKLKAMTQKADFEFDGATSVTAYSAEAKTLPVRIIEKDKDISRSFDATGKTSLADQKARGSVTLYNEFGADSQLLVASTRLLSQEGKVFRLLNGVTVPGTTTVNGKVEPGVIEAVVVADQPGQDYNIAATTFTVPGFEGSPKYAKFYAKSSKAMAGGGASGADAVSVSDMDIVKAKKAVEAEAKNVAEDLVNDGLSADEKILSETIDTTVVSSSVSPQAGSVTTSFEYRMKIHVRAFVFSESDIKKMAITLLAQQNTQKDFSLTPEDIQLQYGEPNEDYASKTLRISVHTEGRTQSKLDEAQLKADLLGQGEADIAVLLQKYNQIDSISIDLWPEFLTKRIPTRPERVTVTVDHLEEEGGGK